MFHSPRCWLDLLLCLWACSTPVAHATAARAPDAWGDQAGAGHVPGSAVATRASGDRTAEATAGAPPLPEPTTLLLFGAGLIALARLRRRRPQPSTAIGLPTPQCGLSE